MTRTRSIGVILASNLLAVTALAQEEDAQRYTYATYFHCNVGLEEQADAFMKRNAPILDGLVEDGTILSWGWLSHHTGGDWRRIRYHQAASPEAAMEALETMGAAIAKVHGEDDPGGAEFSAACPRHDDYLWQAEGGTGGKERGKVGFSVYHFCDINREDRADDIVAEHFAPILDKMVEEAQEGLSVKMATPAMLHAMKVKLAIVVAVAEQARRQIVSGIAPPTINPEDNGHAPRQDTVD